VARNRFAVLSGGAVEVQLGDRLKELMAERGRPMTQRFLAELADVTQPTVGNWLSGTMPQSIHLNRLCAIFGVHRRWLLYGEGEKFLPEKVLLSVLRAGDGEFGVLLKKVAFIEQTGNLDLIAEVEAFLDLACRQLRLPHSGKPRKLSRSQHECAAVA
jgi:transcriptional regulator with XRE-family HTH domain